MKRHSDICRKFRAVSFAIAGVLSLVYYVVCIVYARIGVSWLWIWPLFAAFCFIRFFMLIKRLKVTRPVKTVYRIAVIFFALLFTVVEVRVVSYMFCEPEPDLDYIITLGASVRGGKPTSPMLLRIYTTIDYMNGNPSAVLVASGGKGTDEPMSEADCIAEYVINAGIDPDRVIIEDQSHDTEQNIHNSFQHITQGSTVGVVTSSFHLYRAIRIAELQGYKVFPVPAKTLLPLGIHYTVREFFAIVELEAQNLISTLSSCL